MKKGRKIVIGVIFILLVVIIIYLMIPYSPVKKEYSSIVGELSEANKMPKSIITEDDLKVLPEVIQKYFIKNGYVGIESASIIKFDFKDVEFSMGVNKPNIKIDYTVYDFVKEPTRVALIDSKMFGIPFEGIDICKDGKAKMKGTLAKNITLFNTKFDIIDSSYLSECMMHPSLALQENITYKQIDDYSVEATIRKNGRKTTGIFYFNENYEMTHFIDEKRLSSDTNTYEKWSAVTSDYKVVNGVNRPTKFQAVWNFSEGDLVYFDSKNMKISYE
ncbi:hypothetical protein UT300012_26990 [Paraclostridium bifermentans]|uniref:DUF6544 family protein n=1 Tax=Paraclostridium bifermentans TaxID=1490 RepID=UPI0018992E49|nr:DUF6544 family protein [Paraclostridium bifermentans]MBS5953755.1 hypothetical protein [Paraclostridium bifermentans]